MLPSIFLSLALLLLSATLTPTTSALSPRDFARSTFSDSLHHTNTNPNPITAAAPPTTRPPPSGYTNIHDPSGVVYEESSNAWYVFGTGITSHVSTDGYNWKQGVVPLQTSPDWVKTYVPLHAGGMWAPDISYINGLWHMYYAVSTWRGPVSCIGLATTPSLGNPNWTDSGAPIVCDIWSWTGLPMSKVTINAIDPHMFIDPRTNRRYLNYGSFHAGIYVIELTGYPVVDTQIGERVNVQRRIGDFEEGAEGSWIQVSPSGAFWLFGNWGTCCVGVNSTYNIRIGVSNNPMGPYYDRDGLDMRFNGGTLLLAGPDSTGRQYGPGQIGFPSMGPAGSPGGNMSAPVVSYHYYDGASTPPGSPTLGQATFLWDVGGWPAVVDRM